MTAAGSLPVPAAKRPIGRILLVVEQLRKKVPGGIGTVAAELSRALGALGDPALRLRVALYASASPVDPDPLLEFGLSMLASPVPAKILPRLWDHGMGRPKWQFSVVHATSLEAPPGPSPLVVTVHDLAWRSFPEAYSPHGRRWHEASLRRRVDDAAAFVVPSRQVADALLGADLGIAPNKIEVIEWGVDHLPDPEVVEATDDLLDRLGVYREFLLSVGTLEPRKNLGRLVDRLRQWRASSSGTCRPLVIVGPAGLGTSATGRPRASSLPATSPRGPRGPLSPVPAPSSTRRCSKGSASRRRGDVGRYAGRLEQGPGRQGRGRARRSARRRFDRRRASARSCTDERRCGELAHAGARARERPHLGGGRRAARRAVAERVAIEPGPMSCQLRGRHRRLRLSGRARRSGEVRARDRPRAVRRRRRRPGPLAPTW